MRSSSICRSRGGRSRGRRFARAAAWLVLVTACACGAAAPAHALDPARQTTQYLRDRWSSEHGFPGGAVSAITQTADGYLWIAGEKGLVRFDGINFQLFAPSGPDVTSGPAILGLAPDRDGSLWVRLRGPSLMRFRNGQFEIVAGVHDRPGAVVTAMSRGHDGAMLLATLGNGPMVYRGGSFTRLAETPGLASSFILAMSETASGDLWLGTRDAGLFRLRGRQMTPITAGLPDQKINSLQPGDGQDLWIGTDSGVVRWNGTAITSDGVPPALATVRALAMIRDRDANLWMATASHGLLRVNAHGLSALEPQGGTRAAVSAVFEDRDGNVWIGDARGIERLRDGIFTTFTTAQGLPSDNEGPILVDAAHRVWVAPSSGGLFVLNDDAARAARGDVTTRVTRVTQAGLDQDIVYSIAGAPSDGGNANLGAKAGARPDESEIWIGRQRGGLTRLRLRGGAIEAQRFTQADGLAQNSVYAVHRARNGAVWAGTLSAGVSRYLDGRFTTFTMKDGLASNTVAAIADGADGTMWFATPNGLSALTASGWRRYTVDDGLPSNDVNTLFEDAAGRLWIGTARGLAVRVGAAIHPPALLRDTPQEIASLIRAPIFGIAEDRVGSLWIATAEHVLRVDRERLVRGRVGGRPDAVSDAVGGSVGATGATGASGTSGATNGSGESASIAALPDIGLRTYGIADGLLALDGVKRQRTVVADTRGQIWFAMSRGLSVVDPSRADVRAAPALAQVEALIADTAAHAPTGLVSIAPRPQRITIAYTGLSMAVPERVRFRYRLDGFDRDWSDPVTSRQAMYTNLGPGTYRFRVKASNSDGAWTGPEALVDLEIQPAIWQRRWFRLPVLLVLGGIGWLIYRLRMQTIARQLNARFEARLAERTRIAQELHDTLLQGFVSASMQLHVATDRLPDDSPTKPALLRVQELMRRVVDEGRNAVRGLRATGGETQDLEQAFSTVPQELALDAGARTSYRVIVQGKPRPLNPIIRDEVYRIGREALVNAFRHAAARSIEVELEYASSQLRVLVRDDGRGIDQQVLREGSDGHWGLSGMRERAERIGARFKVWSRALAGTEVELVVPAAVAFARIRKEGQA